MNVILILILASLAMALLFLAAFIWAVRSGQFDDTLTPSMRVLAEDSGRASPAEKARDAKRESDTPET
jgi:cbb3-type cytochrome oxidase maturation protein